MKEGALGVNAGNDGFDGDFFGSGEHDPGNGAVFQANLLDFGIGANFSAGLLRGFGQSAREVTEAGRGKSSGAHGMGVASGAHQEDGGGTRGPRPERGPEDAACGDKGGDELRFEKCGGEVRNGHGAPAKKVEDSLLAKHAHVAAGLKEIPEIFGSGFVDRRRRDRNKLVEDAGEVIERIREFDVFRGGLCGNVRDAAGSPGVVVPEKKRLSAWCGSEDARTGIEDFALEFFDLHVARDLHAKRAERVRERGGFEAGMKFLGNGAAANHFAPLEDERFEPSFGKIKSSDESVVPAADENYALAEGHAQLLFSAGDSEPAPADGDSDPGFVSAARRISPPRRTRHTEEAF